MFKKLFISIFIFLASYSFAQNYSKNADCKNAIEITDSIMDSENTFPKGYGEILEFSGNNLYDPLYFQQEHNTIWYKFSAKQDSYLTFDIIPVDPQNDYDFLLFKYPGVTTTNKVTMQSSDFCNLIIKKQIKPVRTNISRNDIKIGGKTGLSAKAAADYVHAGPGNSYSRGLNVKQGDVYYLVVDNVYKNGKGHSINLHFKNKNNTIPPKIPAIDYNKVLVKIFVSDEKSKEQITAGFEVIHKQDNKSVIKVSNQRILEFKADFSTSYIINCNAKNYLNNTMEITTVGNKNELIDTIKLSPIEVGKSISLENIYFVANKSDFLHSSDESLKSLLNFMQQNPTLKIEIQGHVNWPLYNQILPEDAVNNQKLSENRAKAVCNYLINNGIEKTRLTYKGYSNTRMIYPYATTEKEEQKNRRVEILILSK